METMINEYIGFNVENEIHYILKTDIEKFKDCFLHKIVFGLIPSKKDEEANFILYVPEPKLFMYITYFMRHEKLPENLLDSTKQSLLLLSDYLCINTLQELLLNEEKTTNKKDMKLVLDIKGEDSWDFVYNYNNDFCKISLNFTKNNTVEFNISNSHVKKIMTFSSILKTKQQIITHLEEYAKIFFGISQERTYKRFLEAKIKNIQE